MDEILCAAWAPIYAGNTDQPLRDAEAFCVAYDDLLFDGHPPVLSPVTATDLRERLKLLPPGSAAGVDGWTYGDLALLPDSALAVLA